MSLLGRCLGTSRRPQRDPVQALTDFYRESHAGLLSALHPDLPNLLSWLDQWDEDFKGQTGQYPPFSRLANQWMPCSVTITNAVPDTADAGLYVSHCTVAV